MAIAQIVNDELEEEMMIATIGWATIPVGIKESELDHLTALLESGMVLEENKSVILDKDTNRKKSIEKYASEKIEILIGS